MTPSSGIVLLASALAAGCATSRSVMPVKPLDQPPYFYDYGGGVLPATAVVAHLPVRVERDDAFWLKGVARSSLLDTLTAWLDSAGWTRRLDSLPRPEGEGPVVYVGSIEGDGAPYLDSLERARMAIPGMILRAEEPTKRWRESLGRITRTSGVAYILVVHIGLSDYVIREPSRGPPEVPLGTGYAIPLSRFTIAKETEALHLTGALLDADGRVLRAGAEGILAQKPNFWLSLFDLRGAVSDEAARRLLVEYRREDLPGHPLAWRVALQNLVAQLLQGRAPPQR